jgi:hypothetical protein
MDEHCPLDSIQPYTLAHQLFNTSDMRLDSIQPYTGYDQIGCVKNASVPNGSLSLRHQLFNSSGMKRQFHLGCV